MSKPELKSLGDYQQFVTNTIRPWSREQRIALAAAMAERWLPVYESFSEEEDWGDPSILKRAVDAVWNSAVGKKLTRKDHGLLKNRVDENTPHADDFAVDVEEVIATSAMIDHALDCCVSDNNTDDVVWAMVSAFEGVAPGISTDADEVSHEVLTSSQFRDFLKNEMRPLIDNLPAADEQEVDILRKDLMSTPVAADEAEGVLPPEVSESPQVTEHIEKTVQLRKGLADILPVIAQKIQTLRGQLRRPKRKRQRNKPLGKFGSYLRFRTSLRSSWRYLNWSAISLKLIRNRSKHYAKAPSSNVAGSVAPRPDPRMTNEAVFERYRRVIESDLKEHQKKDYSYLSVMKAHGMIATHSSHPGSP